MTLVSPRRLIVWLVALCLVFGAVIGVRELVAWRWRPTVYRTAVSPDLRWELVLLVKPMSALEYFDADFIVQARDQQGRVAVEEEFHYHGDSWTDVESDRGKFSWETRTKWFSPQALRTIDAAR